MRPPTPRQRERPLPPGRTGKVGEWVARWWLRLRGYRILARNWHPRWSRRPGEIDIIARRGSTLVFVEVKSRRRPIPEMDQQPIRAAQQRRLRRTARAFLALHPHLADGVVRFDLIVVNRRAWPRHWRNIWPE